jgi:transcriptional regulator with XRE-family HTH domain
MGHGHRFRKLRLTSFLTQEHLAQRANVSVRTVQRAEAGAAIRLNKIEDLAAALGADARELVDWSNVRGFRAPVHIMLGWLRRRLYLLLTRACPCRPAAGYFW